MNSLSTDTPRRICPTKRRMEASVREGDASTAYAQGYADACILLHGGGEGRDLDQFLATVRARYLHCIEADVPTAVEHAYVTGFRDAASDTFPCPPQGLEPHMSRCAA